MNECPRGSYNALLEHRGQVSIPWKGVLNHSNLVDHVALSINIGDEDTTSQQKELHSQSQRDLAKTEMFQGLQV